MNPTIDQKKRFECMMNEFAEKHEPMCVRVYNHPDSKYRTNIVFSTPTQRKEYTVVWSEARSLTDAATAIFTDVSLEFGLVRVAPSGVDFTIKNVIFNDPATIVFWMDGTKTVVKCQEGDIFDPEKGLAMAISKKALGNKGNYCNQIKKWTEKYEAPVVPTIGIDYAGLNKETISSLARDLAYSLMKFKDDNKVKRTDVL